MESLALHIYNIVPSARYFYLNIDFYQRKNCLLSWGELNQSTRTRKDCYTKNTCETLTFSSPGPWSFHLSLGDTAFLEEQGKAQSAEKSSEPGLPCGAATHCCPSWASAQAVSWCVQTAAKSPLQNLNEHFPARRNA